jgi:hypothetical protein
MCYINGMLDWDGYMVSTIVMVTELGLEVGADLGVAENAQVKEQALVTTRTMTRCPKVWVQQPKVWVQQPKVWVQQPKVWVQQPKVWVQQQFVLSLARAPATIQGHVFGW